MTHLVTDRALATRLERAEGAANAAFVVARAAVSPQTGATWAEFGGALAMFDGVGSPLTQTFGLGLRGPAGPSDLAAIEAWFGSRGADIAHELSPLADSGLLALLQDRGYRAVEQTTVLLRPPSPPSPVAPAAPATTIAVRVVSSSEADRWAEFAALGWGETTELAAFMRDFGGVSARARGMRSYVAEVDGQIVGTAGMAVHDGIALLAGASTLPASRRRGVQAALLAARLADASSLGCALAVMGAAPGSTSQCNAERAGFRIAYTRTKWMRPPG